ncbi:MAG: 50S ribosomal protein L10 [Roseiflexaceae bacterium]|nr:50S ribosomal protein L10 [Roseiflexaceae bacterium]
MPTQRKIDQVAELTDKLARSQVTLIADYRGMTVSEITGLRNKLRQSNAELIVAKNTLVEIAARATGHTGLESLLAGPTAVAFAYDDATAVAKAIQDFNKGPRQLNVRGGLLGTSLLQGDVLDQVSKMPTRQQVLAQIVGGVAAPVSGVVGVINAAVSNVLYVLQARIDQQGGEGVAA